MKTMRIFLVGSVLLAASGLSAQAQATSNNEQGTVTLKDGQVIERTNVRVGQQGGVTVDRSLAPGVDVKISYDPKNVAQIEFSENPLLKRALDLIAKGKPAEALELINPVLLERSKLEKVKGNNFAQVAVIKAKALAGLKREQDAKEILSQLTHNADDPEVLRAALVQVMAVWAKSGNYAKALETYDKVISESDNPETVARAWCSKGDALFALEQYDSALLAYLRVPTLYSDQKSLVPQALLGSALAYLGMEDKKRALQTLRKIVRDYPSSAEATKAKKNLQNIPSDEANPGAGEALETTNS
jgi:tetratricopeptide (TPR) repeat protein